jgi:sugar diacid utilization regulator
MQDAEREAIKQVIEKAYIQGIHGNMDEETIRSGFHQDFTMFVKQHRVLEKVSVSEWQERLERMRADNPELWSAKTTHTFVLIDVSGYAAAAKLDVYKGEIHFSTDYMLLYKFEDGWKIVSKVFAIPG